MFPSLLLEVPVVFSGLCSFPRLCVRVCRTVVAPRPVLSSVAPLHPPTHTHTHRQRDRMRERGRETQKEKEREKDTETDRPHTGATVRLCRADDQAPEEAPEDIHTHT